MLEAKRRNSGGAGNHRGDAGAVLTSGNDCGNGNGAEEEIACLFADNVLLLMGCTIPSGLGKCNVWQAHHPMLVGAPQSNMDVVFEGTASCTPGTNRGVSCTALHLIWWRKANKGAGMASRTTAVGEGSNREGERAPPGLFNMYYTQSHSQQRHRRGLGILIPRFLVLSFCSFQKQ